MGSIVGDILGMDDGSASRAQIAKQEAKVAEQEQKVAAQQSELAQTTQARILARRAGGQRSLLSAERENAVLGIQDKLGA